LLRWRRLSAIIPGEKPGETANEAFWLRKQAEHFYAFKTGALGKI
jgi:hypothetical protein